MKSVLNTLIFCVMLMAAAVASGQPWTPTVIWDRSGATDSARYGGRVFALGDQNGDGYSDWGVSAFGRDFTNQTTDDLPYVELFHGGNPPLTVPYLTLHWSGNLSYFYEAASCGDLNGDGYIDWYVRKQFADDPNQVYEIYFGGFQADSLPDLRIRVPNNSTNQVTLLPMGDFNGDGFDDLYRYDFIQDFGQVYFGGNPMDTLPDWTRHSHASQDAYLNHFGDLNGDGYSDWISITIEPDTTHFWVYLGSSHPDTVPAYELTKVRGGDQYFYPMSIVNDLNNDGRDEVVTQTVHGGWNALAIGWGADRIHNTPDIYVDDGGLSGVMNTASVGDFSGDGCKDFWTFSTYRPGQAVLYLSQGGQAPLLRATITGQGGPLNLTGFRSMEGLGDVNGDGIGDVAISTMDDWFGWNRNWRGRVIVIAGDRTLSSVPDGPSALLPDHLEVTAYPNPFNSRCTVRIELPVFDDHADLTLFNLLGQLVLSTRLDHLSGAASYALDAATLSTGVYLLQVHSGTLSQTQRLVVLK